MKQCIVCKHKNPDSNDLCAECKFPIHYPFMVNDNHFESWKDIVVNPYYLQYQIHQLQTVLTNIQDGAGYITQSEDLSTLLNNFDLSALLKKNYKDMTPAELKFVVSHGHAKDVLKPFDEIQIMLADGREVTAICGDVKQNTACFVIKTILGRHVMNYTRTNKTGYKDSAMRRHVLKDILPLFPKEWRDIMKPRKLKEFIQGETVEHKDKLWLLPATNVFGLCPKSLIYWLFIAGWTDIDDSYQLPIFEDMKNRIFTFRGEPCKVWLRSPYSGNIKDFCDINTNGIATKTNASYSCGVVTGFDI